MNWLLIATFICAAECKMSIVGFYNWVLAINSQQWRASLWDGVITPVLMLRRLKGRFLARLNLPSEGGSNGWSAADHGACGDHLAEATLLSLGACP